MWSRPAWTRTVCTSSGSRTGPTDSCDDGGSVPLLHIHGDAVPLAKYEDNRSFIVDRAARRGCSPDPVVVDITEEVRQETFTGCAAELTLMTILGGGHHRPGDLRNADNADFGPSTLDVVASEVAWEWFEAHPGPVDS